MPHPPKSEAEQDLRLVYVLVVIVEALVIASLYWLGRSFA
jgi:hypothetical protein